VGAPKLGLWRERQHALAVMMYLWRDPHCEVMLSGSANHFEVMLSGSTKVGFSPPKKERKKGEKPIEGMGKWHTTLLGS